MTRTHCAHRMGCWWHQLTITTYRTQRAAWQARIDAVSVGYPTEAAEAIANDPAPTFKAVLKGLAHA